MPRLRESIINAQKKTWPGVKQAIADAVTPVAIDKLMRTKQSRSSVRFVVEQTIEEMAAAGLLRTPADAAVIERAVDWANRDELDPDADVAHDELIDAVEHLQREIAGRPAA